MTTTKAYRDGFKRGENAAGWWTQENGGGRDTRGADTLREWAKDVLRGWDDGDYRVADALACPVNLSGEWAGDATPETVADLYRRRPSPERLADLCTDWESGAQDGWTAAILSHLKRLANAK